MSVAPILYGLYGMVCGVGFVAVSAFLAVVLVFLFVAVVGALADAVNAWRPAGAGAAGRTPAR